MSENAVAAVAVTINVAPAAEERVIDWLLSLEEVAGFTSYAAFGHGASHDDLSVAEQVTGRQRRVEIRLEIPSTGLDSFVGALTAAFDGTDLYYYGQTVLRSGHLRKRGA